MDFCIRILVIGKTGIGKSSLVKRIFGVDAEASHHQPGHANIDDGLISTDGRFIVHDSQGFEPTDQTSFEKVKAFVDRRMLEPHIQDQIHVIWFCLDPPRVGSRLFECGSEYFLDSYREGTLGKIPFFAVFTRIDQLHSRYRRLEALKLTGPITIPKDQWVAQCIRFADDRYDEICVKPITSRASGTVTIVAASNNDGYERYRNELLHLTLQQARDYLSKYAGVEI